MKCALAFLFVPGAGKTSEPSFWEEHRQGFSLWPLPTLRVLPVLHPWKQRTGWGGGAGGTRKGRGVGPECQLLDGLGSSVSPPQPSQPSGDPAGRLGEHKAGLVCLILLLECFKVSEGLTR